MKKLLLAMGVFLLTSAFFAGQLFAYNYSYSPSYARTLSRAATIGTADAVYYNPVGLVEMKDGLYLDLGNQMGYKKYSHKVGTEFRTYADTTPTYLMPNFALIWKKDKGALALSVYVPAGGGSVNYNAPMGGMSLITYNLSASSWGMFNKDPATGLPYTSYRSGYGVSYIKANSTWIQGQLSGAYKFTDIFSVTGGIRFSRYSGFDAAGLSKLGTLQKNEYLGYGFSGFAGFMIAPVKEFALTAMYATQTFARGSQRSVKNHYSKAYQNTLDDYVMVGINLKPIDKLSIQVSYQLTFEGERKLGTSKLLAKSLELAFYDSISALGVTTNTWTIGANGYTLPYNYAGGNSYNWKYKNAHMVGLGIEYAFTDIFTGSIGGTYTNGNKHPRAQNPLDPCLTKFGVGLGFKVKAHELVDIDVGVARYFYKTERMFFNVIKLNKEIWNGGIGITIKAM